MMANKMNFSIRIACFCILLNIVKGQDCTYLYTSDYVSTFDSHTFFGIWDYNPYENNCWIIEAPYGMVVHLDSEYFELEDYCPDSNSGDRVNLYSADWPSRDKLDATHCGYDGVNSYRSSGRYAYVEFKTDGDVQASGFRISYTNKDENYDDDEYYVVGSVTVGALIGIIIGSLLALGLIIGLIICCVVCAGSMKKRGGKIHTTTPAGQNVVYNNQAGYPRQQASYPTAGYATGVTMAVPAQANTLQHKAFVPPPPPQQASATAHPVDANGIPLAAIYNEPRALST